MNKRQSVGNDMREAEFRLIRSIKIQTMRRSKWGTRQRLERSQLESWRALDTALGLPIFALHLSGVFLSHTL